MSDLDKTRDVARDAKAKEPPRAKDGGIRRAGHYQLGLTDPEPMLKLSTLWRNVAQSATIGIFVIMSVAALYFARPVLLPAAAATVIGLMLGPLSNRADRAGVPPLLSAIVLWLLVIAVFYGVIALLASPVADWIGKAPEITQNIKAKLHVLDRPWTMLTEVRKAILGDKPDTPGSIGFDIAQIVQPVLLVVTPAIGQIVIFFGTLFFFLAGRNQLRHVLVAFFDTREARLRMLKIMNDVQHNLTSYLSVVAVINLIVGITAGVVTYFAGLPNVVAWAVLGFILNFVPYIGALLMQLVLLAVGLVTFPTLTQALVAPVLYLAFTTFEGHFVTPSIMGRRLTLNPLTVFLSLVFWTWLWGPVGAFLAVPIVIVALVIFNHLFPKADPALPS
ncbi:MAG: AI-2E family transporter [Pseudolabrys sp.]|nr:AI-2E family transporter [Pseudolabrys sp.]